MSKAEGRKIGIKFTMPLIGDVTDNVSAFTVSGREYKYVNGPLIDKEYAIDKVERYGVVPIWNLGESHDLSSEGGGYVLEKHDTNSTDSYGPSMIKGNIVKFKEDIVLVGISLKTIASGAHTVNVKSAYNGTVITSGSVNGDTRGEWIDIILGTPVEVIIANKSNYYIEIVHPTGNSYVTNTPRYNGTLWDSEGAYFGTWYGANYTFAMGVISGTDSVISEYEQFITSAVQVTGQCRVRWLEDKPTNTNITIEYTTGAEQGEWLEVSNGDVVTSDTNLWFRVTLETKDASITPTLQDLWIEDLDTPQDKLLITINQLTKFNNVEGKLKVSYNAALGSLVGVGGAVQSFDVEFTPADLYKELNPNPDETIKGVIASVVVEYDTIIYIDVSAAEEHTITASPVTVYAELVEVGIVNP